MIMTNVEIKIPETIRQYALDETTEKVRNAILLYPSIANDAISHGKAAELLGLSKMELIQIYDLWSTGDSVSGYVRSGI